MPTYEYECTKCNQVFELFQPITDKPKRRVKAENKNCACDAPVRRRIGTGAGIIFKGAGFYQTDYRSDSYRKGEKAAKDAAKPESKSDSKDKGKKEKAAPKTGSDVKADPSPTTK